MFQNETSAVLRWRVHDSERNFQMEPSAFVNTTLWDDTNCKPGFNLPGVNSVSSYTLNESAVPLSPADRGPALIRRLELDERPLRRHLIEDHRQ